MKHQSINIDLLPNSLASSVISVKQYDYGERIFDFYLSDAGTKFVIPQGTQVTFEATKPDGKGISIPCTYKENVITCDCTKQMSAVAGNYNGEIRLTFSDGTVGSSDFLFCVYKSGINDTTDLSESDYSLVRQAIDSAKDVSDKHRDVLQKAKQVQDNALSANNSATLAKESQTNAKTSQQNAKLSQTNSKTSQTNAKTSELNAASSSASAAQAAENAAKSAKASQDALAKIHDQYKVVGTMLCIGGDG